MKNVNVAPVANAGAAQTVNENTKVTLDGSASKDSDGTIAQYAWKQIAGPTVTLTGATTAKPTFTAPIITADTALTFELTVTDNSKATAKSSVIITVKNVNVAPVASGQTQNGVEDTGINLTLVATDADGDKLTYKVVSQPLHGNVTLNGATVVYKPVLNYNGTDSFTFIANDGKLDSRAATINLTITPVNDVPVANAQSLTVAMGSSLPISLAGTDVEDGASKLVFAIVTPPAKGKLGALAGNALSYTPNAGYTGNDTFTFKVTDTGGALAKGTVSITVVPKPTLSGATAGVLVVGGTVTLKDLAGKVLGTAKTDLNGAFAFNTAATGLSNGYALSLTGGTVDSVAFTGTLTATYAGTDAKTTANLTAVTTLVDSLATTATGATKLAKRDAAIQQLAKIGMVKADNWNLLTSDYFDLSTLALRIKDAGGTQAWLDVVKADLADGELSVAEMRSLFPKAHGGLESASVYSGISVFPGDKSSTTVTVEPMEKAGAVVVKLLDAPSWVKVVGNTVTAEPPTGEAPAVHTVNINVSADGVLAGRKTQLNISVLKQVTLLHGVLGPEGGKIENAWRDIAISAPAGKLTQNYEITYHAGINVRNEAVFSFEFNPEIPDLEREQLDVSQPTSDVLRANYLGNAGISQNYRTMRAATTSASRGSVFLKPGTATEECWTEWEEHGFDDGENGNYAFPFTSILQSSTGSFSLNEPGTAGDVALGFIPKSATPRVLPTYAASKPMPTSPLCASMLVKYNSKISPAKSEPILLIHGYAEGKMGGIGYSNGDDPYFFKFPKLLKDAGYPVYGFFWNTNQRFEDAANDLGAAIKIINEKEKSRVHIIAHSYGGLLTRTLLQGFARTLDDTVNAEFTHSFMENRIASVTTVGTPHSGVFGDIGDKGWKDAVTFDNGTPIAFKYGRHGYAGTAIELCAALTCHEAGEEWMHLGMRDWNPAPLLENFVKKYDKKETFGVEEKTGQIAYRLAKAAYPNVPTQVLIGILPESQACNDPEGDGICNMEYSAPADKVGDGLISLAGQRFYPWNHKKPLLTGNIEEHLLGFNASFLEFKFDRGWQDKYVDYINRETNWKNGLSFSYELAKVNIPYYKYIGNSTVLPFSTISYNHRGKQYALLNFSRAQITKDGEKGYINRSTPMLSEVGLQNCTSPTDCNHATWKYVNDMIALHPAKSLDATPKVKAKGSVGYAAPAAARTAGTVALAASETVESFVVNIFLDGEQLGTTTTNANGAFDLDVEFKPKRTYVLKVSSPASMDAAVAPRAIVVKKTSGLTVEDTDFDFSRLELIKNANVPQQGELGIQLKDDSTGNVLLGYNLSVANFSYTLVNAKPINADSDAILTLPESLYAVTTTKSGYIGTGKSLCMVRKLASNPCVVTMLANNGDKDRDGLSNLAEYNLGTNPAKADTDGDGYTDKQEVDAGSDPLDKGKYPTLSAPQNLKATPGDTSVALSWDAVTGANAYNVCYATVSIANFDNCASYANGVLKNTGGTGLALSGLTNGTAYYFRVQATDANGNKSPASAETTATPSKADLNAGLVAHWSFDDCTAKDVSGNGNNGEIRGNPLCTAGVQGKSLKFNGVGDYIQVESSSSLNVLEKVSFGAWVKLADITRNSDNNIILNKEGIPYELAIHDNQGGTTCFPDSIPAYNFSFYIDVMHENQQCGWADGGHNVPKDEWVHLFVSYDGYAVKTYYNGYIMKTYSASGYIPPKDEPLLLAARWNGGIPAAFLNGTLDDIRIYNRALSESEVKALYQSGGGSTGATGKLNDTGITTCGNATQNNQPCPLLDYPNQDGDSGRDVTANDDSDGHAGFSYTKISSTGAELPASATEWSCVKDNVTGLMWEVKTDDGGLHDKDWTYSWYEPDNTKNGGYAGTQNGGDCGGTSQCDTYAYVQAVNAAIWCGAKDWRMPTERELKSIVRRDRQYPTIDMDWFPNTLSTYYWSSSPVAGGYDAWVVNFSNGDFNGTSPWDSKGNGSNLRLVRGGQ